MKHILVVEDERKIADILMDYLIASGFKTSHIDNGLDVSQWVRNNQPDLILLDIMLPGKDGLDVCKELRQFTQVPIMMVTARVEEIDRILGLEIGADDYICKPFSTREVVARVKALLRRLEYMQQSPTLNNGLKIDEQSFSANYEGSALTLTPVEFKLLSLLSGHPERVYHRDQLLDHLYDDGRIVTHRTIDTHIKNLRKKLHNVNATEFVIESIYGIGYKWHLADEGLLA